MTKLLKKSVTFYYLKVLSIINNYYLPISDMFKNVNSSALNQYL